MRLWFFFTSDNDGKSAQYTRADMVKVSYKTLDMVPRYEVNLPYLIKRT